MSQYVLAKVSFRAGLLPLVEAVVSEELEVQEVTQLLTAFAKPGGLGEAILLPGVPCGELR